MVSISVSGKQLLCFVYGQGQKREQKHTTNTFVEFHNHSPLINYGCRRLIRELNYANHDGNGNGNENATKRIGLKSRTMTLQVRYKYEQISLPSTAQKQLY